MAVGDYEQIENDRRRAFKRMRGLYDPEERAANERRYAELSVRREQYLRDLLAQLPFPWHVEHAYTPRETAMYGGADHIVVDAEIRIGRLVRKSGDTLSRPRTKFCVSVLASVVADRGQQVDRRLLYRLTSCRT